MIHISSDSDNPNDHYRDVMNVLVAQMLARECISGENIRRMRTAGGTVEAEPIVSHSSVKCFGRLSFIEKNRCSSHLLVHEKTGAYNENGVPSIDGWFLSSAMLKK